MLRFHAVYWPAMLLSSGQPLPTRIFVHDYLTAGGRKISKSAAGSAAPEPAALEPAELAAEYGTDAVRWWLLREVPRVGDADFTVERLVARADDELANGLGNLVNRVVAMIGRYRAGGFVSLAGYRRAGRTSTRRSGRPAAGSARRLTSSTSGGLRRRSGRSRTRRTGSSTASGPGTWPGRSPPGDAAQLDAVLAC